MGITSKRYHWTVAQKQEMRSLYEEGYSYVDIAKRFGCQCETIRYHLQRMGVAARGVGMQTEIARKKYSGDKHHGWNGGTFIDHGYRKVLAPSHPFKDNDGYVAEHRLVVENHLQNAFPQHPALRDDGFLKPDWIVHHQDHNKLNNKLDNLIPLPKGEHSKIHNNLGRHKQRLMAYVEYLESQLVAHGIDFTAQPFKTGGPTSESSQR